jgi:hypothetical protein
MRNRLLTVTLGGTLLLLLSSANRQLAQSQSTSIAANYGNLPMSFEPNKGQFDRRFFFGARGFNYSLLLNSTTVTTKFRTSASNSETLEMTLLGANDSARLNGTHPLPGISNYYSGNRDNWITNVPTYEKVEIRDVYSGVDAVYYGNQNRFEYDFIVNPGASADVIGLSFKGASQLALSDDGELVISKSSRELRQSKPYIYQMVDGRRTQVMGAYVLRGKLRVGFHVEDYDHSKPLIIDPQLVYSTFVGPIIRPYGIAVDSAGNAYICGATNDGREDQAKDAYVAKYNAAGTAILWSNSFGSFGYTDTATAIVLDAAGNVYATGLTEYQFGPFFPPFPTTPNAIHPGPALGWNSFVTKFDTNGKMLYSTYLGGDRADGIAVDSIGNMYIAGTTSSASFPVTKAFQSVLHGSSDAFITVLNAQGSAFIYSTYLGGSGSDAATGIAVDRSGNAYVTGTTTSANFPTANPIRPAASGGTDSFVVKLNPAGSAMMYGTYLGGSGTDIATGIAVDNSNNAYVSGRTNSPNFPTISAFQSALKGGFDVFVTKVNSAGTAFSYSTYLGGSNDETTGGIWCEEKPTCAGIAVNSSGNAYVTDVTASRDFPQVRSLQSFKGVTDAFVTELSLDGKSLVYSTLLGGSTAAPETGSPFSSGSGIAYVNGNAYIVGFTDTTDFPVSSGTYPCCISPVWNGVAGFIAKLADDTTGGGPTTFTRVEQNSSAVTYTGTWYTNTGSFNSGGSAVLSEGKGARATFTFTGTDARWIGNKDAWSGIANVYVDGVLKGQVDTYSPSAQAQAVNYTISGLSSGTHTLAIEVSGTKNPSSQSFWIWVDAFDYANNSSSPGPGSGPGPGPGGNPAGTFTRVQQNSSTVSYTGTWYSNTGSLNSGGSAALAINSGARATFTFTGTAVKWIGYRDPWSGIANVYVDGVLKSQVDTYAASAQSQTINFTITGLSSGNHTITIEATGRKDASAQSAWVWVDAFEFLP